MSSYYPVLLPLGLLDPLPLDLLPLDALPDLIDLAAMVTLLILPGMPTLLDIVNLIDFEVVVVVSSLLRVRCVKHVVSLLRETMEARLKLLPLLILLVVVPRRLVMRPCVLGLITAGRVILPRSPLELSV